MTIYKQSIMDSISVSQTDATPVYKDNTAAIATAKSSRSTCHTSHVGLEYVALLDWNETN